MKVIALPAHRASVEDGVARFEQLALELSSRLTCPDVDEISVVLRATAEQVGVALGIDCCRLLELTEDGVVRECYSWIRPGVRPDLDPAERPWLLRRLARVEHVTVAREDDLPREAEEERSLWRAGEIKPMLMVPVAVGGRAGLAMMLSGGTAVRLWPPAMIDRLRLLAQIIATAVQRHRQESVLRASLAEIERLNARLKADNGYLQEEIKSHHDFDDIVGQSQRLGLALARVSQVAPLNSSVLLLGETGTGKELFARALHDRSRRRSRTLVRLNCAALPATLVESELFGHEKGAFTGATGVRQGRFELADGGTLFLDEIGDLPLEVQAKLLRVLQEGEFERLGSSRMRKVDVRLIVATHRDLEADVAAGRFRADLYYRLAVFPICLPALRDRREDIPSLVWYFIHRLQRELGRRITKVPQATMAVLQHHDWPGNVRELENVIERAMIRTTGDTLELDDTFALPQAIGPRASSVLAAPATATLDAVQRAHIEAVLQDCGWRINGVNNAASRLGLHPNTLRFRMHKLGIQSPSSRSRNVSPTS